MVMGIIFKHVLGGCLWQFLQFRKLFLGARARPSLSTSKTLVISCLGLGNSVLSVPFVTALKERSKEGKVDVLALNRSSCGIFMGTGSCHESFSYEQNLFRRIKLLWNLRKNHYDLCFLTFPTLSLPMEVLPLFIGGRYAICHDYSGQHVYFRYLRGMFHELIPIDSDIHDIEQNFALLDNFTHENIRFREYPPFKISSRNRLFAQSFLKKHVIEKNDMLMVVHPGSKRSSLYKRWPLKNFVDLARLLQANVGVKIVFVLGPDEEGLKEEINRYHFSILQSSALDDVMAVIDLCSYFISNDSGIMHVASLLKVPIFAIWGGTDERRNGARGLDVTNIANEDLTCRPCIRIVPEFECQKKGHDCITGITVEHVYRTILERITLGTKKGA
jgi:ADP-heptose:LPS heptosyltransferase